MTLKAEFLKLFRESFSEPAEWLDWFGNRVYRDDDFITLDDERRVTSGLLLSPYTMLFQGMELSTGYISCVATAREHRGKGLMHTLMRKALNKAAESGMTLCTLIPASDSLYFLYDRFGFATVIYIDEQRYTSLHQFVAGGSYTPTRPTYEMLSALERSAGNTILHSRRDFDNIITDIMLDGGIIEAVESAEGSRAMAFTSVSDDVATVKYLPSTDPDAAEAVLAAVRAAAGERRIVVWETPAGSPVNLRSRGMARIVNAESMLDVLAAVDPKADQVIRVSDPIILANNATFILKNGRCTRVEHTMRTLTLDVSIDVLTRIVFSDRRIGDIFGLPSGRPIMPLMLD